jgi:glycosyltransferase involved in cell wall biosynthesis
MPAIGEGFGLAAAEALMQGVPVIACTDGGGLLDVVPPSGAGRRAAPTPAAMAQALHSVLADPHARQSAHTAGAEWRERLAPGHVADRCLAWYREALDE